MNKAFKLFNFAILHRVRLPFAIFTVVFAILMVITIILVVREIKNGI